MANVTFDNSSAKMHNEALRQEQHRMVRNTTAGNRETCLPTGVDVEKHVYPKPENGGRRSARHGVTNATHVTHDPPISPWRVNDEGFRNRFRQLEQRQYPHVDRIYNSIYPRYGPNHTSSVASGHKSRMDSAADGYEMARRCGTAPLFEPYRRATVKDQGIF